ncbi:MAG: hypothetical protein DME33_14000 [Verrucomicrobia bacterium]|nr:MAG: hypothetical protein DME33_14000 [Verrucomicrobiota bacterium]
MQNFFELPFDVKEQIESAYKKRGVILVHGKKRERTIDFSYADTSVPSAIKRIDFTSRLMREANVTEKETYK